MNRTFLLLILAVASASTPALAYDDEMLGTMVNGRTEVRTERSARVQDFEMDREEMIIDREKRQGRNTVKTDEPLRERQPFDGPLPD